MAGKKLEVSGSLVFIKRMVSLTILVTNRCVCYNKNIPLCHIAAVSVHSLYEDICC